MIRIMCWNIEKLSANKTAIPGLADNIARVIVASQADIVIILEVTTATGLVAMQAIAAAALPLLANSQFPNAYQQPLLSHNTGGECYGAFVKDLDAVRPINVQLSVVGSPLGTHASPLSNLDQSRFVTWPAPFPAAPQPLPAPPAFPLIDIFSSHHWPRRVKGRDRFAGRNLAGGGYSLGRGFRMPCLMMFEIRRVGNPHYVLPIVACHLGAVRSGSNHLGRSQIKQYKQLHISQKFQQQPPPAFGEYIVLNGVPTGIRNLIFTGDFNVDFMRQSPPLLNKAFETGNRAAWAAVTPYSAYGWYPGQPGAVPPAALPPPATPIPAAPVGMASFVGSVLAAPPGPDLTTIDPLALKVAVATQNTILRKVTAALPAVIPPAVIPPGVFPPGVSPPPDPLRSAGFDNFFFGGVDLSPSAQVLTPMAAPAIPVNDAGQVIDLPRSIAQPGLPGLDVSAARIQYASMYQASVAAANLLVATHAAAVLAAQAQGVAPPPPLPPPPPQPQFHYAHLAPNLSAPTAVAALTDRDRLIGARFISDHLPVVVQFNLPP